MIGMLIKNKCQNRITAFMHVGVVSKKLFIEDVDYGYFLKLFEIVFFTIRYIINTYE